MFREKIIIDHVRGKDVLDIGSVGQTEAYNLWIVLKQHAGTLTGIDIEPSVTPGVVHGNMETYQFNRQFDVVMAGDVIEHVSNPGLFLNNIRKHLREHGVLAVTTPNAKWPTVALKPNPTHVLWHDRYTLTCLLRRCGFEISYFSYYFGNKKNYPWILRPLVWRQGLLLVARKNNLRSSQF